MVSPRALLKASIDAGRAFLGPASGVRKPGSPGTAGSFLAGLVPIRLLGARHAGRLAAHLLALDLQDRYLRFGYAANDEQIRRYVSGINFGRDRIFGIYNRRLDLIATAHLAFSTDVNLRSCAEFGVSVLERSRGRGFGLRLFERAVMHARNDGVDMLFIHALSENTVMLNIARKGGATIVRDGSESEAYLKLPPADIDSRLKEVALEQMAQTDYRLKAQARQFRELLAMVQEVRRGVREARDNTSM